MVFLGVALSLPFILLAFAISTVPVWLAAKVVGAHRSGFLIVAGALLVAVLQAIVLIDLTGAWALLLVPIGMVLTFSRLLETSILGAIVLCLLSAAFQAMISKLFGV